MFHFGKWGFGRSKGNVQEPEPYKRVSTPDDGGKRRRLHLRFVGQVQAVGFRWNARKVATEVGCTGWVENKSDGSVEMELQGTDPQICDYFGLFAAEYRSHPIQYQISEREDIPLVPEEQEFVARYEWEY